jgi:hypothetical protein
MKINPYKIGMNFYIILIVSTIVFLGSKTYEKHQDEQMVKRQVEAILNTPNLK